MPLTININYSGNFPANAQNAVRRAADTWQNALNSNVDVEIQAYWAIPLGLDMIAMCIPFGFENSPGAPSANTWYTGALADKLANQDLQPGFPDMAIYFNSDTFNFHTGQGAPPANEIDLESNALHEMCHGLGFLGLFWVRTLADPQTGSYGSADVLGQIPGGLPIPFQGAALPALNGHPSAFGRFVQDGAGTFLWTKPNNSQALAVDLQSNNLTFRLDNNQTHPIYAPNRFKTSSTGDHFRAPPPSLMQPVLAPGVRRRNIGQPVLDALARIGS